MRNVSIKHIKYAIKDYYGNNNVVLHFALKQIILLPEKNEIKFICKKHLNKYLYPIGRKYQNLKNGGGNHCPNL